MSNTLVSKQLTLLALPDNQMSHLNSIMSRTDSSMPETLEGSTELLNSDPTTEQLPSSRMQQHSMDYYPTPSTPRGQDMSISYNLHEQSELMPNNVDMQQFDVPSKEVGQTPSLQPNSGQSKLLMTNKRKASAEPGADNWGPQKMSAPNKRVSEVGSNARAPSVSQAPPPVKKSMPNSRSIVSGRKVVHVEPVTNKSQPVVSKRTAQPQVSPKSQPESYDSVRAKLRESLASALALVSQQQESSSDGKMKTENEAEGINQEGSLEHKPSVSASSTETANLELVKAESCTSSIPCPVDGCNDNKNTSLGIHSEEMCEEASQMWSFMGTDSQSNPVLSGEDGLFTNGLYFKDELLQGNGLSWVSDFNPHISEVEEVEHTVKPELLHDDVTSNEKGKTVQSPESLAFEIESELFKLFGGVNKKYKEKGRSLLFNLKDRNNPELSERVMSGEIPPDRLCSMTAEELASKELSQWRIAKAEELDHMKVLPVSDINMRRLVKKTHKGEYQVDLGPDIGASEENSLGASVSSQNRSKISGPEAGLPSKADQTKAELYDQCEITIPSDGTDMQGLMVDDVKDLPPIVSLDEFMESLNKEPPFENLPVDSGTITLESDKENLEVGSESRSPVQPSKHPMQITSKKTVEVDIGSKKPEVEKLTDSQHKTEEVGVQSQKPDGDKKSTYSQKGLSSNTVNLCKHEHVWEGQIQINLSSMANFVVLYKSGEKASAREWPGFFDIKGRVRLDAFDKFLQALPMSRTRTVMVSHFVLKGGSTDSEHASLLELVDSYIMDERLGFAEPAPGVELYLCPPRSKTVDMIIDHLPKSYTEKLNDIDDGLIGIVVWRKVQLTSPSAISPNSFSHQKHKANQHSGSQNAVNDVNRNNPGFGFASRGGPHPPTLSQPPQPQPHHDDDDDDVPPGFGPPGHRDNDDLPEFNFSGGSNQPTSLGNPNPVLGQGSGSRHHHPRAEPRQVEQMRELVQKYGQNETKVGSSGIPTEPWNDDDDDDIPEWQPHATHQGLPTPPPQPVLPAHVPSHPSFQRPPWPPIVRPHQPLQPPMSVQQQRAWWPYGPNSVGNVPSAPVHGNIPSAPFYGPPGSGSGQLSRDWRPNNRGF